MGFSFAGPVADPQLVRGIEIAEHRNFERDGKMPIDFRRSAAAEAVA
jgi:hypothetical protein